MGHALGSRQIVDRTVYISPDGQHYNLHAPEQGWVLSEDGFGMPPWDYVTERGPFQHGETVKAVYATPRVITVLIRRNACSRAEYWDNRYKILDILRPYRIPGQSQPGLLRKYMANGQVREFLVYPTEGPSFPPQQSNGWDQWSIQDSIKFTAYDPIARDPQIVRYAFVATGTLATFPITFPLTIASFGGNDDVPCAGTWETYPDITINGPLTGTLIRNLTTGEKIALGYTVPSGRVVTMILQYGHKTVTLDDGTNLIGYVTSDSDIGTFHLVPGENIFQVTGTGTSSISSVILQWYDKYVGI